MDYFKDKVTIVTGGASGIGRALCEELGEREAVLIVADINKEGAHQTASSINKSGGRAQAVHVDVSEAENVQNLIDETALIYGRLDCIINNAGICVKGEVRDINLASWRDIINVNQFGVLYGTISAYSLMVRQGFGHIVNIASLAGLVSYPVSVPYAVAKHAVVGLSTSLRVEAADLGVRVSVVCPGYVKTGISEASPIFKANREDVLTQYKSIKKMNPTKAAKIILQGVARNQGIIVFPFKARLRWWLFRIYPALLFSLGQKIVRDFRILRSEQ